MGIVFNPIFGGRKATREERVKYLADAHAALQKFNDQILTHDFVASNNLSIADIQIFFELSLFFFIFQVNTEQQYPKIHAWHQRVRHTNAHVEQAYQDYSKTYEAFAPVFAPHLKEDEDEIVLYQSGVSNVARSVRVVLNAGAKGKYQTQNIDLFKGEHKQEAYLKINPMA